MRSRKISHNQLSLPFGQIQAQAFDYENRQKFFWFLVGASILSLGAYMYAIAATAHNTAVRQNLEAEIGNRTAELSSLEFKHIALKNAVTLEVAHSYGFTEVEKPLYVSRLAGSALTLNTPVR